MHSGMVLIHRRVGKLIAKNWNFLFQKYASYTGCYFPQRRILYT
jgi:hypothetical protein